MKVLRFIWKLSILAGVFGIGYIVGREHSFEEEELWNEENDEENKEESEEKSEEKNDNDNEGGNDKKSQENDESEKSPKPATDASNTEKVNFVFNYESADASKVAVVGDFNAWNKDATPLTRDGSNWTANVSLKPGKHEYQFVINDTDWVTDPKATNSVKNKYEGMNSVLVA